MFRKALRAALTPHVERYTGIEPAFQAWEACVLTVVRIPRMVPKGPTWILAAIVHYQTIRNRAQGWSRTSYARFRKPTLYPLSYMDGSSCFAHVAQDEKRRRVEREEKRSSHYGWAIECARPQRGSNSWPSAPEADALSTELHGRGVVFAA